MARTANACGQVWHVPEARPRCTGHDEPMVSHGDGRWRCAVKRRKRNRTPERRAQHREYRAANPEKVREYDRKRDRTPERRARHRKRREANPERTYLLDAMAEIRKRAAQVPRLEQELAANRAEQERLLELIRNA